MNIARALDAAAPKNPQRKHMRDIHRALKMHYNGDRDDWLALVEMSNHLEYGKALRRLGNTGRINALAAAMACAPLGAARQSARLKDALDWWRENEPDTYEAAEKLTTARPLPLTDEQTARTP